jgi:hypothetical protein
MSETAKKQIKRNNLGFCRDNFCPGSLYKHLQVDAKESRESTDTFMLQKVPSHRVNEVLVFIFHHKKNL